MNEAVYSFLDEVNGLIEKGLILLDYFDIWLGVFERKVREVRSSCDTSDLLEGPVRESRQRLYASRLGALWTDSLFI